MFMKRTLIAAAAALALAAAPVYAESEAEPVDLESVFGEIEDGLSVPEEDSSFAETIYVVFEDAYRNLLAEGGMDASWLQSAQIDVNTATEGAASNVSVVVSLNESELYHMNVTLDLENMTLTAQCPELKEQPLTVDLTQITPSVELGGLQLSKEQIQELLGQFIEFAASVPAEQWQESLSKYLGIVMSRLQQSTGTTTVTLGDMSVEASTMTFGFDSTAVAEAIPELLTAVAEDGLIKSFFESDFMDSLAALIVSSQGGDPEGITGEVLYEMLASTISETAVTGDFSSIPGAQVTIGFDEAGTPCLAQLDLLMSGMTIDVCKASFLASGDSHAYQVELGAMLASALGFSTEELTGLQGVGGIENGILSEDIQVFANGEPVLTFSLSDFDLNGLAEGIVSGTMSCSFEGNELSLEYFTTDEGWIGVTFAMNGETYFTEYISVTEGLAAVEKLDPTGAFPVADEESLYAYLEDADPVGFLQKLADAGVPQELIDALMSDEGDLAA